MKTKLDEIFTIFVAALEDLSKSISKESSGYQFEATFNDLIRDLGSRFFNP